MTTPRIIKALITASLAGLAIYGAATSPAAPARAADRAPLDITPYVATPIAPVQSTPIATVAPAPTIAAYHATLLTPYHAAILTPYHATPITAVAPGAEIAPFTAPPVTRYTAGTLHLSVASPIGSVPGGNDVPVGLQSVSDASFAMQTDIAVAEDRFLGWVTLDGGFVPSSLHTATAPGAHGRKILVYQTVTQVHADRRGRALAHIHLGLHVRHPLPATVTIVMNTGHGLVATHLTIMVSPSRH